MVREAMVRAPRLEGAAALWGAHFAPSQVSGDVAPCITVSLLEAHQCNPNEDELKDIQDISVNIYGGESWSVSSPCEHTIEVAPSSQRVQRR